MFCSHWILIFEGYVEAEVVKILYQELHQKVALTPINLRPAHKNHLIYCVYRIWWRLTYKIDNAGILIECSRARADWIPNSQSDEFDLDVINISDIRAH